MRYDPVDDIAPPPLGSWWRDRITGRRYQVEAYDRYMGRVVEFVTLKEPGSGPLSELKLTFTSFRAEFVPADAPSEPS